MTPITQIVTAFVPRWILWALVFAAGAASGAQLVAWSKNAELATLRETHAQAAERAEQAARTALQDAQDRGDEITHQLHSANRAAMLVQEKLDEQIRQATTGRRCLDGAALRLLDSAPGIARAGVPETAREPAAAHAASAAADPALDGIEDASAAAADTDVALWARAAAGQYAECVRRFDALIDWHDPTIKRP